MTSASPAAAASVPEDHGLGRIGWKGHLLILLIVAASLYPFGALLVTSFLPPVNGAPGQLWRDLFSQIPITSYMLNSAIVSGGAMVLVATVSCMAGYSFAKLTFPGSVQVIAIVIAAISVPQATTIIPNYLNFASVGGVGAYWGPVLMYAASSIPFATVLMTSFFKSLPDELLESAVIDGASYAQIFLVIMVPLATPALATVGVLAFLTAWNDLLVGLLFLPDPALRTISVGIATLQGVRDGSMNLILTGSLVSAIPPILAFIFFQKYLVSGIVSGMGK